ncbi:MAG TPA: carboxypeptidase-like regulatory domain-containing protein [Planctomycetota bacterium]
MRQARQGPVVVALIVLVAIVLSMGIPGDVAPTAPEPPVGSTPRATDVPPAATTDRIEARREAAPPPEPAPFTGTSEVTCEVVRADGSPFPGAAVKVELGAAPAQQTLFLTADPEGFARICVPGVQSTKVTFLAASPAYSARPASVFTRPGHMLPTVRLWMCTLDAWVRGVVTDLEDRPLANARVSWRRDLAPTSCDAGGRFAVQVPSGSEDFRCLFLAPGHSSSRENLVLPPGADVTLHVRLQPGPRIRGRVVDPDGKPVAGAEVATIGQRVSGEPAITDADGRYELDCTMEFGPKQQVAVRRAGYVPTSAHADTAKGDALLDFTLQVAGIVRGRVLCPDGRPAAGAEVRSGGRGIFGDTCEASAADENGIFVLDELAPGEQQLHATCAGFPPATSSATVVLGVPAATTITFGAGHVARGVVVDDEGRPVRGAWVGHASARTSTAAQGRFALMGLPEATNTVDVMERAHVPLRGATLSTQAENRFVLARGGSLQGMVVDARTGAGLDDFTIAIVGGDGMQAGLGPDWVRGGRRFCATAGHWAARDLMMTPGSAWRVRVTAPGYAAVSCNMVAATTPEPTAPIAMTAGVLVRGSLMNASTRVAVAGASLQLLDHEPGKSSFGQYEPRASSGDDGAFQFTAVAPGQVWLAVEAAGTAPCKLGPFTIGSSDADLGELRIGEGAVVTGTLRDADGRPLGDRKLLAHSMHTDDRHPTLISTRTGADGSFMLTGLEPGTWRMYASVKEPQGVVTIDQRVQVVAGRQYIDVQPAGRGTR